jgi:cytochrome c biogenesis protein CcdA
MSSVFMFMVIAFVFIAIALHFARSSLLYGGGFAIISSGLLVASGHALFAENQRMALAKMCTMPDRLRHSVPCMLTAVIEYDPSTRHTSVTFKNADKVADQVR